MTDDRPKKNGLVNGAYGLSWAQHEEIVRLTSSGRWYTEKYLAEKLDVSVSAIRDICRAYGWETSRLEHNNDGSYREIWAKPIAGPDTIIKDSGDE